MLKLRLLAGAGVLLAAAGAGIWAVRADSDRPCRPLAIKVAAASAVTPPLRSIAARFNVETHEIRGRCVRVEVTTDDTPIIRQRPDAWVPESSLWLAQTRNAGLAITPMAPSVAATPVVLATTRPVAERLQPSWRLMLQKDLARHMQAPSVSATGIITMIAMNQVARPPRTFVPEMRRATPVGPPLDELVRDKRPLVVTTEQAVVTYNQTHSAAPAAGLIAAEGTLMLDYPYAVTATDDLKQQAAEAFKATLRSYFSRTTLHMAGFRNPDGTLPVDRAIQLSLPTAQPKPLKFPTQPEIDQAQDAWIPN